MNSNRPRSRITLHAVALVVCIILKCYSSSKNVLTFACSRRIAAGLLGSVLASTDLKLKFEVSQHAAYASTIEIDGEVLRAYRQGQQNEVDGNFQEAQQFYESVVQTEPDYMYSKQDAPLI